MSAKLSTITTQYRRFTKNQVLTEGHLNEVVDFFDDQDRLTRTCLSGVGIVCGFNVSLNNIEKNISISISQGTGITTDGDLFHLYGKDKAGEKIIDISNKIYTSYKIYDNKKTLYKPFFYNGKEQLEMVELLTEENLKTEKADYFPLATFEKNQGFAIKDAVAILYLETYEKELDLCVSLSCDNQGLETIGNQKVLLVHPKVATQINSFDSMISQVNFADLYYQLQALPDVISNRIVLKPNDFSHYNEVKNKFTTGIFKDNVVENLLNGYVKLLTVIKEPALLASITTNIKSLFGFKSDNVPPDFQYRYDLLKDLVDTYNELKLVLLNSNSAYCFPDFNAFPKHLMLGEVVKKGSCVAYRHAFYKTKLLSNQSLSTCNNCLHTDSPAQLSKDEKIKPEIIVDAKNIQNKLCFELNNDQQLLFSLIMRSVQLLENYNSNFNYIKITPSLQLGKLGQKAIPFYNNVGDQLIRVWDFYKTAAGNQRNNLSYHTNLLNAKRPLEIIVDSNFYRIEGHQGQNYKEVLKIIEGIRRENGLGFNVVVIGITAEKLKDKMDAYTNYYLNKNHGMEHKAGVAPGGTFVMVYLQGEYNEFPYPYGYGYPYEYPYGNYKNRSLAGDFEIAIKEENSITNPIIADFTLPYLCCDENFITLSLPIKKLCFDEKTMVFPFHVTPSGGFVKADVTEGLNGGVTVNQYNEFVFDPKLVSKELIGKEITFTVNNFETNCSVTVFDKPSIDFDVFIKNSPGSTSTEVTFSITTKKEKGNSYSWDFGDNSKVVVSKENSITHLYEYKASAVKTHSYEVKLIANNGNCSFEVSHPISFDVTDPKISIDSTNICSTDKSDHLFIIEPKDAAIKISGEGVSEKNGQFVFNASKVFSRVQNITILVNDVPSKITINLQNPATVAFDYTIVDEIITFNNTSKNAVTFTWTIEKEAIKTNNLDPIQRSLSDYKENTIKVTLTATSAFCGEVTDSKTIVIREEVTPQISIDSTTICRNDSKDHVFAIDPKDAKVTISGEGISDKNGQFTFNASKISTNTISIIVMVNGKPSGLIITIQEAPIAAFSHAIDKENIVFTNISKNGASYTWNIAGEEIKSKDTTAISRPLLKYDTENIAVSLVATNKLCGTATDGPRSITIREKSNTCLDDATSFIGKSTTTIASIKKAPVFNDFNKKTILLTNQLETIFATVAKDIPNYINGNKNRQLRDLFPEAAFKLLTELPKLVQSKDEITAVQELTRMYTELFYTVLRCQDPAIIKESRVLISRILVFIDDLFNNLAEVKFSIDPKGTLKSFLNEMIKIFAQIDFMLEHLKIQIEIIT